MPGILSSSCSCRRRPQWRTGAARIRPYRPRRRGGECEADRVDRRLRPARHVHRRDRAHDGQGAVARPVIFRCPIRVTRREARPQDLETWSGGRAVIGTGSPFPPVVRNGKPVTVDQTNNAYVFPASGSACWRSTRAASATACSRPPAPARRPVAGAPRSPRKPSAAGRGPSPRGHRGGAGGRPASLRRRTPARRSTATPSRRASPPRCGPRPTGPIGCAGRPDSRVPNYDRHPEVAAKRPSKDERPDRGPIRAVALRGSHAAKFTQAA